MDKPKRDIIAEVPQIKVVMESEEALKEIKCLKKQVKKAKKEGLREEDAKFNLGTSIGLRLNIFLAKLKTSSEKLENETGIPKNKVKDFFVDFFKEKVFSV